MPEPKEMPPPQDCPKCQAPLTVLLFLGIQPDFYVCETCKIAYSLDTLRPVATVIG